MPQSSLSDKFENIGVKYCSLDIETTGFDPAKDEILEIGFGFFDFDGKGVKSGEEYSKIFRPKGEVSETILALTGLTRSELNNAGDFDKHKGEIQEKLKNAVLVGHNIGFDVKFLEGLGLKLSGRYIDTLDLAQFILPTRHSYNLENLMHYFGVPHIQAHRALADAKASLRVLEGLLGIFAAFPENLKKEILNLLKPVDLALKPLLTFDVKAFSLKSASAKKARTLFDLKIKLRDKTFYNFSLGAGALPRLAGGLKAAKSKGLIVVPGPKQVLDLWRRGICEPAFNAEESFSEEAFKKFRSKPGLTADERKFVIKILVWQKTNWQTRSLVDLNLSFFGGQFRHLIAGGSESLESKAQLIVCSLPAFLEFKAKGWYKNRSAVFFGLMDLENALSENGGERLSWNRISSSLKSFFNPETGIGETKFKKAVEEGLRASDLFFGLVSAFLQTEPLVFLQIKLDDVKSDVAGKIRAAAENFQNRLKAVNSEIQSAEIESYLGRFGDFFISQPNRVKWLELSPYSCVFHSRPINLQNLSAEIIKFNRETFLGDCLPEQERIWGYFQKRLGLADFASETVKPILGEKPRDRLAFLKPDTPKIKLEIKPVNLTDAELARFSGRDFLPAALIFASPAQIKSFFHKYHAALQKSAFVLAQSGGSGGNRILRNFAIHKDSLLLASGKFILKSLFGKGAGASLGGLPVKTLVLGHLPFEQFTHPYLDAVSKQFDNAFEDFSLPRALLNLHKLVEFFYSPSLKRVVVADPKLSKGYARLFLDYLKKVFG